MATLVNLVVLIRRWYARASSPRLRTILPMASQGSRLAVVAAFVGNGAIAVAKFVVAGLTGSAAMLSEGFHSVADTGNQGLLLFGMRSSKRDPDARHPFGRGKEIYFWGFMVAVMLFAGGAVLAFNHGIEALRDPHELGNLTPNFIVLAVAMVIEGFVFAVALKEFNRTRGSRSLWRAVRDTKDTSTLVVLLEDSAAMLGLVVAALGLFLSQVTGDARWDGVASLVIGAILTAVAIILAQETRLLLIGEGATRSDRAAMRSRMLSLPQVESVGRLLTMHLGPEQILVNADVDLVGGLTDDDVEAAIDDVEAAIREILPQASDIFVELESRG